MKKRTTINDLARALDLSPTLISMVLNGKGDDNKISKDTQRKVLETAKKLNYTPNQNARALRTGKTHVIGLIVPDISNAFYSRLARLFEDQLWQKGYRLVMGSTDENVESEKKLIRLFTDQNVDGIIAASTMINPKAYQEFFENGKAVVLFDRTYSKLPFPSVSVQNREGAYNAIEELIRQGKRKLGYLTLTPDYISPLRERAEGYKKAMKKNGLDVHADSICEMQFDEIEKKSHKLFAAWLKKNDSMDGILVANNSLMFQFMKFIKSPQAPKDRKLSIISFDDHMAFELSSPAVTAIAQPVDEIAGHTVELMLKQLEGKEIDDKEIVLPVSINLRQSHLR